MLQLGNLSAWVSVSDVELPQYSVEYSVDGTLGTCWIASKVNKAFTVCWSDSLRTFSTACADDWSENIVRKKSVSTSLSTERPLVFSHLELTDDDKYLESAISPELGEIKLQISEVETSNIKKRENVALNLIPIADKIHERAKKDVGHRIKLGSEHDITVDRKRTVRTTEVRHLATFIFKYRPLDMLKANGIAPIDRERKRAVDIIDLTEDHPMPRASTSASVKSEVKNEGLEENEVLDYQGNQNRPTKRIKMEVKSEINAIVKLEVKSEVKSELKSEYPTWRSNEVIDLT